MTNRFYKRGAEYERKLMNEARKKGHIAFRSAGSHSPVDVVDIDAENRIIRLIQAKKGKSEKQMVKIFKSHEFLGGVYYVEFCVL